MARVDSGIDNRSMLWRCPACDTPIRHSEVESELRRDSLYRCHVCRLELKFDSETNRLVVKLFDEPTDRKERTLRRA